MVGLEASSLKTVMIQATILAALEVDPAKCPTTIWDETKRHCSMTEQSFQKFSTAEVNVTARHHGFYLARPTIGLQLQDVSPRDCPFPRDRFSNCITDRQVNLQSV